MLSSVKTDTLKDCQRLTPKRTIAAPIMGAVTSRYELYAGQRHQTNPLLWKERVLPREEAPPLSAAPG